jgi:nuclear transport factor 2 (NTF2) superfamily protein
MTTQRPPLPPFTVETAIEKVRLAEDGWNSRDPEKVALAYTVDSYWRNRAEFVQGREAIVGFLTRKWQRELDYRLIKELWGFRENRMAVRFAYRSPLSLAARPPSRRSPGPERPRFLIGPHIAPAAPSVR